MPIEQKAGGLVITGENSIRWMRLVTLRNGLQLEIRCPGLKLTRGRTIYSIVKQELGFKGSKQKVWDQLDAYIRCEYPNARSAQ